jgi:prevent-host-death family protein
MAMVMVTVEEAKKGLSELVQRVQAGEEVVITEEGVAVARLSGTEEASADRILGQGRGLFSRLPDLDVPLPDDIREALGA